ncbi:MAG: endonuclease/exonuclease/phosphatase family protein [Bryobacteraceae bacterium]
MLRYWMLAAVLAALGPLGAETLRVMTFNVRYPAKGDGPDRWEVRQDTLVRAIALKNPDVFGTQELFHTQGEYIVANLREYQWIGNSRRGNREDEHMGVFFKPSKLRVIEAGNFWLSEMPEVAASQAWGATLPRMVTWAQFEIRESGRRFYFYNTHFHHTVNGNMARVNSAKLIAARIATLPAHVPLILTGDFNAGAPGADPYKILSAILTDSRVAAARKLGPEGTWSGFKGESTDRRIDWILYRGAISTLESETVTYNESGRYPSDHYPVFAVFELN